MPGVWSIFLGVVFALLYVQLRRTYTIPKRWPADGPGCGNCAYSYTGQPVCPECGHTIKHVGIVTPQLLIMYGPGERLAFGCLVLMGLISAGCMFAMAYAVERAVLPPAARSGAGSRFSQSARLHEVSFSEFVNEPRSHGEGAGWDRGNAPFGLTVVEQAIRTSGSKPPFPTVVGEVVMIIRPVYDRPYVPSPTLSVFDFVPPLPHLRIDIVKKSVRVFDAKAKLIAEYPNIDVRAFADLVKVAGIKVPDKMNMAAMDAAEVVYKTIAAAPDDGGWSPGWSFSLPMRGVNSIHILAVGGAMDSVATIPALMVPSPHVITYVWPTTVVVLNIAAAVLAYRWILRRRKAILEVGAK